MEVLTRLKRKWILDEEEEVLSKKRDDPATEVVSLQSNGTNPSAVT